MIDVDKKVDYNELMVNAKEVFTYFTDDLSKDLFKLRWSFILDKSNVFEFEQYAHGLEKLENYKQDKMDFDMWYLNILKDNTTIIIYGFGLFGTKTFDKLKIDTKNLKNVEIIFCDKDYKNKQNYLGCKVISPDELKGKYSDSKILIGIHQFAIEIEQELINMGIDENQWFKPYKTYEGTEKQYFDEDIIKLGEDEVFVDGGVLNAGTSIMFAKKCSNKYNKIYLFEPGKESYDRSKANLEKNNIKNYELHEVGLWDKKETITFLDSGSGDAFAPDNKRDIIIDEKFKEIKIEVDSLDNILRGGVATFIKMDIEGSELNALKGAKETIKKHKPKLAISIYHKPEDIIEIPAYIKSLVPEYKLYLRHYSNIQTATVLYAVIE